MPKVSIVVPIYNVEKYLRECLDSLVNQTLRDIEIVCVNDGSTDNCLAILNEYAAVDSRIKVIDKPNSGYGHTMNVGMDAAGGEYVGIVEPDDYVKLDMYETLYEAASKNDLDFVKADFYRFTTTTGELVLNYCDISYHRPEYYNRVINPAQEPIIFKFIMNTWSGIYKREFLQRYHVRHNETPGASYQDNGFYFQTMCLATRVYFINKPFYMNRRDNPNSSIHNKKKVFAVCEEFQFIRDFLERNPELKDRFVRVYTTKKYHSYMFTYRLVAEEYKIPFLDRFAEEFRKAMAAGEVDKALFSELEWKRLSQLIQDPEKFHQQFDKIGSRQPGKVEKLIYHWRENGLKKTLAKIVTKLGKQSDKEH